MRMHIDGGAHNPAVLFTKDVENLLLGLHADTDKFNFQKFINAIFRPFAAKT